MNQFGSRQLRSVALGGIVGALLMEGAVRLFWPHAVHGVGLLLAGIWAVIWVLATLFGGRTP